MSPIRAIELLNIFLNKNEMIYREENNSLIEALKSERGLYLPICTATDVYNIIEKVAKYERKDYITIREYLHLF